MRLGVSGLDGERLGVIGPDGKRLLIALHRLVQPPQALKGGAKIVVRLDEIGRDGKGLGNQINGNVVVAHLVGDHTQQMQGDRLIGVGL